MQRSLKIQSEFLFPVFLWQECKCLYNIKFICPSSILRVLRRSTLIPQAISTDVHCIT